MRFNPTVIHPKDDSRQNGSVHPDQEQSNLATVCVDLSIQKIRMTTVKFYKQVSLVCIRVMVDSRVGLNTCSL